MEKLRDNIEHIDVARLIAEGGGRDFLINLDLHLPRKEATNLLLKGGFIIILCKGNGGSVVINGKEYRVEGNNVIVLSENQLINYIEPVLLTENNLIALLPEYILRLPSPVDTNFFSYSRYRAVITLTDAKFADLHSYYRFIHKEMHEEGRYQREIVSAIFSALMLEILAEYERVYHLQPDMTIRHESLSDRFFRLLALHFREERTVQHYASRLYLTPYYLSGIIKKETGKTAMEWIHLFTINLSKHYLADTDKSIKEIADTLHFPDPSTFGRYFKHHMGCSPGEYRKAAKP